MVSTFKRMQGGEERTASVSILPFSFILLERRENICLSLASPFSVVASCGTNTLFLFKRKRKRRICCVPSLYSFLVGKFLMRDVFLCFSSLEKKEKKKNVSGDESLRQCLRIPCFTKKGKGKRKFVTPDRCRLLRQECERLL